MEETFENLILNLVSAVESTGWKYRKKSERDYDVNQVIIKARQALEAELKESAKS